MRKISVKELAERYELKPNDMMVYFIIRALTKKKGECKQTYGYIEKRTNLSYATINKSVLKLEDYGLIEKSWAAERGHYTILKAL